MAAASTNSSASRPMVPCGVVRCGCVVQGVGPQGCPDGAVATVEVPPHAYCDAFLLPTAHFHRIAADHPDFRRRIERVKVERERENAAALQRRQLPLSPPVAAATALQLLSGESLMEGLPAISMAPESDKSMRSQLLAHRACFI